MTLKEFIEGQRNLWNDLQTIEQECLNGNETLVEWLQEELNTVARLQDYELRGYLGVLKKIDEYKKTRTDEFFTDTKNFDMSELDDILICAYNPMIEGFDVWRVGLPHEIDFKKATAWDAVVYLLDLQKERGGTWRFTAETRDGKDIWFEISDTYFEYEWLEGGE